MASKVPKKANLLDHHSIKHILDESVSEVVTSRGYVEDVRLSNARLFIGAIIIVIALFAQFYKKKFPENRDFLIACIALYPVPTFYFIYLCLVVLILTKHLGKVLAVAVSSQFLTLKENVDRCDHNCGHREPQNINVAAEIMLIIYTKEKNAILFTYPPVGSFTSTGLVVSSKLPRFSDMYTLTIASADPKSISANEPVHFTKSVTQWFTKDGILVEGLFWKDVEALIVQYTKEPKKGK
ncbi:putative signal peptidase complex subunit 2 [Glycine max]|nr:putative signal peptidase complex subunit 2 [Glycine max]